MVNVSELVRRGLVPFNESEKPDALASSEAIVRCTQLATHFTKESERILLSYPPLRFLSAVEVLMATHHRHTKILGEPTFDVRIIFGQDFMNLLMQISERENHPPRGSHWNMWIDNHAEDPVMYTDHPDERRFGLLVRKTHSVMRSLCDCALAIIAGQANIREREVAERLRFLSDELEDLRKDYFDFGQHSPRPNIDYEDRWFLHFRQFLAPLEIGRRIVRGPNPAHVASWPEADILFGLSNETYLDSVRGRYCSFLPEELFRVQRATALPTVPDILREELSISSVSSADRESVVDVFRHVSKRLKAVSGVHWSAIVKHLKKPAPLAAENGLVPIFLSAGAGVSGRDLRETEELLEIRRNRNPANNFLSDFDEWNRDAI